MATLRPDQIEWVLSLDAKGVQSELHSISNASEELTKKNKELEKEVKAIEKQMRATEKQMQRMRDAGKENTEQYEELENTYNSAASYLADYTKEVKQNNKAISENNTMAQNLTNSLRLEDMTMTQLKKRAKDLETQLSNTSKSTDSEAYNDLSKRLTDVRNRMTELNGGAKQASGVFGNMSSTMKGSIAVFAGNMMTKAVELAKEFFSYVISSAKEFVVESINMAAGAEGVKRAFDSLNQPGLLDRLRQQTRGTMNDLQLMEASVKADKYKIPLQDVGNLLEFAGRRAIDMNKNVDDFQKRIIEGIGKQSKVVLDDLGLSATEINRAIAKEGSFAKGVISIVNAEIEKQGELALTAADKAKIASVKWENAQLKLGNQLLFVKNIWSAISGEVADFLSKAIEKYAPKVVLYIQSAINGFVELYNNSLIVRTGIQNIIYGAQILFELFKKGVKDTISSLSFLGEMLSAALTFNPQKMQTAFKDFLNSVKDSSIDFYAKVAVGFKKYNDAKKEMLSPVDFTGFIESMKNMSDKVETAAETVKDQRKRLNLLLEKIETEHQRKIAQIKEKYLSGEISNESAYNQKLYAQEQANYILREKSLEEFLKKTKDKELRSDISKQLADIRTKRLDEEIKLRTSLEKIILDANPEEKEKQSYSNRLRELGLYGKTKTELQFQQIDAETKEEKEAIQQRINALELLEKQHQDNLFKIRTDAKNTQKKQSEDEFNNEFSERKNQLQDELNTLMQDAAALSGGNSYDADVAVHQKRLQLIYEEIEARKKAGLDTSRLFKALGSEEANLTKTIEKELSRRISVAKDYGNTVGSALTDVINGQKTALAAFGDAAIDILFDVLTQIINAEITKVTAATASGTARATIEAMATPGSALTFGAKGFATTAILVGAITAASMAAKSALKGLLGNSKSSSNSSSSSSSTSSGRVVVNQRAEGKYDVVGASDGKSYTNVPFSGDAQTGIYSKPTLVGERGAELVVSHPDMLVLQRHVNYPLIVQAINESHSGSVQQRASGKYNTVDSSNTDSPIYPNNIDPKIYQEMLSLLRHLSFKGVKANIGTTELQAQMKQDKEIDDLFSMKQ